MVYFGMDGNYNDPGILNWAGHDSTHDDAKAEDWKEKTILMTRDDKFLEVLDCAT